MRAPYLFALLCSVALTACGGGDLEDFEEPADTDCKALRSISPPPGKTMDMPAACQATDGGAHG